MGMRIEIETAQEFTEIGHELTLAAIYCKGL